LDFISQQQPTLSAYLKFPHLVRDVQGEGGVWTPVALMGLALRKRLTERAGLTFSAR
jgi:hypothetical protein